MKCYDEVYTEIVPFKFIRYIIFLEGGLGLAFLVLYLLQTTGNPGIDDEMPAVLFLIIALIMLAIAAFLNTLLKMRIGITLDSFRASLGFIKFEVPLTAISRAYKDEKSSLKYGGWGVRMRKYNEGWVMAYTTIGYRRVVLQLEGHKYKRFIFSTAHPEEVVNVINRYSG